MNDIAIKKCLCVFQKLLSRRKT